MQFLQKILNILIYSIVTIKVLLLLSIFLIIFGAITYKNENIIKNKKASITMLTMGSIIFLALFILLLLLLPIL